MPKYNDTFNLSIKDIELIEEALRKEISALKEQGCDDKIKDLHLLLGKFHNQKVFYNQAHHTGTPAG